LTLAATTSPMKTLPVASLAPISHSACHEPTSLQPIAAGTATLRRYDDFIDGLVADSAVPPALGLAAKVALGAAARPAADGSQEMEARVPITVQDGYLSVGPVRLLALPRIIWQ